MTTPAQQSRPGGGPGAAGSVVATPHQDTGSTPAPHLSADEIAAATTGYVLIVKTPTDRIVRRVFLSLHSAVKAAQRAQDRGHAASVHLVAFRPAEGGGAR